MSYLIVELSPGQAIELQGRATIVAQHKSGKRMRLQILGDANATILPARDEHEPPHLPAFAETVELEHEEGPSPLFER